MTSPGSPSSPPEVPSARRAVGFAVAAIAAAAVVAVLAGLLFLDDENSSEVVAQADEGDDSSDDGSSSDEPQSDEPQSDEQSASDEDESSDATSDESSDPPNTLPGNTVPDDGEGGDPAPAGDGALEEILPDLIAFVESERGLTFITQPVVVVQPEAEFVAGYNALVDEDLVEYADEYVQATEVLQAADFLDEEVTFEDAIRAIGSDGVLGYYETEVNELFVRGDEVTPFVRTVIVHELTHALDDQHFELHRPEYDDRDDEIGFGLSAVVEGNASRVEDAYRATFTADEEAEAFAEESSYSYDFSILRYEFLSLQIAPYIEGEELVLDVLEESGQPALDALFVTPPTSSEQVLHPDRLTEPAAAVPLPPADGEILDQGTFGEVTLQVMLEASLGVADARDVAEGWGGDAYVAWLIDDGDACVRTDMVSDTGDDFADLVAGLEDWADDSGATIEEPTEGVVRFTICG